MKKILTMVALVAMSGTAIAQGPTLYGTLHTSVDYHDNNGKSGDNAAYDDWNMNSNGSKIGVKGSEDLGNGMQVGYLVEWHVDSDGDTGNDLGMRNRAITLSGDYGTGLVGKWNTPFKTMGRRFDMFGDQIGDTRNLTENDDRVNNIVMYSSPNMNGFTATAGYVFDETTDYDNVAGYDYSHNQYHLAGYYNNGPIKVGLAYAGVDGLTGEEDATSWRLGGAYTYEQFTVLGQFSDYTDFDNAKGVDFNVWSLGGAYQLGNNKIKAQYSDRSDTGNGNKDGADMWSVGVDHTLSKRSTVYVAYASTSNDSAATFTSWNGGHDSSEHGAIAGQDADSFSMGIIHKF